MRHRPIFQLDQRAVMRVNRMTSIDTALPVVGRHALALRAATDCFAIAALRSAAVHGGPGGIRTPNLAVMSGRLYR